MKNKKIALALACAFMMTGVTAHAEEYRLAFSKSEQIEIIVNNANVDNWCSANLKLEARYKAEPNPEGLARLMPKIGQLMKNQCPQATEISWVSTNRQGKQLASGNSVAATDWVLNIDSSPQENKPTVVATTTQPQEPRPSLAIETQNELAIAPVPEQVTEPLEQVNPITAPTSEKTVATTEKKVEAKNNTTDKKVERLQQNAVAETEIKPKDQSDETALPATPKLAFEVNGWKPNANRQEVLTTAKLTEVKDQNGCKLLVYLENSSLNLEYTHFKTEGLNCKDHFAQGPGKASIVRSDGNILNRASDYHFSNGLALKADLANIDSLNIVAAKENGQQLWLYLGEDAEEKSYYLLGLSKGWGSSPFGPWFISGLDIITEQNEIFRKENHIREQINKALSQHPWLQESANDLKVSFFSDFKRGILENQLQGKLYSTTLYRSYDWRKKQLPPWELTSIQGTNYLFQRDEATKREEARIAQEAAWKKQREEQQRIYEQQQLARQKQQELYATARKEARNIEQFNGFETALQNGNTNLLAQNLSGLEFTPFGRSDYYRLMHDHSKEVSLLVRVDKTDNTIAQVNWPYPLELNSPAQLEKGWYWISGKASLDKSRTDANKLPVIKVAIDSLSHLLKCEQDLCKDLENPLALTRIALKNANWDIAQAQSVIKEYEEAKKTSY